MINLKGKFEWEDSEYCHSYCDLPAFGVMKVCVVSPVWGVNFTYSDLDKTWSEIHKEYDEKYKSDTLSFLKKYHKEYVDKKIKDTIWYNMEIYKAYTDCSSEIIKNDFKTIDEAKKYAENWYLNEIKKFIEFEEVDNEL